MVVCISRILKKIVVDTNIMEPIVVDLDGTLVKTDLLHESAIVYVKKNPLKSVNLLLWLLKGVDFLKKNLAEQVQLDIKNLPYNQLLLEYLATEHKNGRILVLATASHQIYADQVARHLGIFSFVFATRGSLNLKGNNKLACLLEHFGEKGFDYIGDSSADLVIFPHAKNAILVNPKLLKTAKKHGPVECRFS